MAREIQCVHTTAKTVYALVFNATGSVWRALASAFESYLTANRALYAITLTEQGTASGLYMGTFPSAITAGVYGVVAYERAGGSPAETDAKVAVGTYQWTGSALLPLSGLA